MAFAIYDVAVGVGRLGIAPIPCGDDDLEVIAAWGAQLVMSMTMQAEMTAAGMPDLGRCLGRRNIKWYHVPVGDYGVPEPSGGVENGQSSGEDLWEIAAADAVTVLAGGGRVLVHCKGGCGRSGMAALRLMVLVGEAPDAALARLRDVRPCAIETDAQMAWARG